MGSACGNISGVCSIIPLKRVTNTRTRPTTAGRNRPSVMMINGASTVFFTVPQIMMMVPQETLVVTGMPFRLNGSTRSPIPIRADHRVKVVSTDDEHVKMEEQNK